MNKMLVVVFDSETQAFEGLSALKDLHKEGSLTVYSTGVIAKGADGAVEVKQAADRGPKGTFIGMATGSLIGLLAGPVGMVVGASAGAMVGVFSDFRKTGISSDFLADVSEALTDGKSAVLAEVDETWVTPVDTRLGEHGGMIFRRLRSEVIDDQIEREYAEMDAELAALDEELQEASDEAKQNIQENIAKTKKKIAANRKAAESRIETLKTEAAVKIEAIEEQIKTAKDKRKAKLEARKAEIEADYAKRSAKLKESWELTKEALKP